MKMKYFDSGSLVVILLTFILFAVASFVKGITHELLLEAGVLLVSVKLIMMNYKTTIVHQHITRELQEIKKILEEKQS
jgi:hypothetical protein